MLNLNIYVHCRNHVHDTYTLCSHFDSTLFDSYNLTLLKYSDMNSYIFGALHEKNAMTVCYSSYFFYIPFPAKRYTHLVQGQTRLCLLLRWSSGGTSEPRSFASSKTTCLGLNLCPPRKRSSSSGPNAKQPSPGDWRKNAKQEPGGCRRKL